MSFELFDYRGRSGKPTVPAGPVVKCLLRRYRTLRSLGVGRIASVRVAWREQMGEAREPERPDYSAFT